MARAKRTTISPGSEQTVAAPATPIGLEDVIVALQKSFSRVSYRSAKVAPEDARALVVGRVGFELALKVEPEGDNRLLYSPSGAIELKLSGSIDTDIRPKESNEGDVNL